MTIWPLFFYAKRLFKIKNKFPPTILSSSSDCAELAAGNCSADPLADAPQYLPITLAQVIGNKANAVAARKAKGSVRYSTCRRQVWQELLWHGNGTQLPTATAHRWFLYLSSNYHPMCPRLIALSYDWAKINHQVNLSINLANEIRKWSQPRMEPTWTSRWKPHCPRNWILQHLQRQALSQQPSPWVIDAHIYIEYHGFLDHTKAILWRRWFAQILLLLSGLFEHIEAFFLEFLSDFNHLWMILTVHMRLSICWSWLSATPRRAQWAWYRHYLPWAYVLPKAKEREKLT